MAGQTGLHLAAERDFPEITSVLIIYLSIYLSIYLHIDLFITIYLSNYF